MKDTTPGRRTGLRLGSEIVINHKKKHLKGSMYHFGAPNVPWSIQEIVSAILAPRAAITDFMFNRDTDVCTSCTRNFQNSVISLEMCRTETDEGTGAVSSLLALLLCVQPPTLRF